MTHFLRACVSQYHYFMPMSGESSGDDSFFYRQSLKKNITRIIVLEVKILIKIIGQITIY